MHNIPLSYLDYLPVKLPPLHLHNFLFDVILKSGYLFV